MLNFIVMTISIALGIMIASGVMFAIVFHPRVIKWYFKQSMKMIEVMSEVTEEMNTETESE